MSVTMHRSGLSLPSSSFSRDTGGAMKTTNLPPYSRPVAGTTRSSSSYTSMRSSKPLHSSSGRSLPNGPGPILPNRPTVDYGKVEFIVSHSGTSTSRERTSHVSCHRPSAKHSATTQRRASDDSRYGSRGKDITHANNYRHGSLAAGRKSKSLSQLNSRDETSDFSPLYNRTGTESFSNRGVSDKMGLHHTSQRNTERDFMASIHYANTNTRQSLCQSTTHSDFRDPKAEDISTRTSLTKPAHSRTLDRDLPTGYGNKNNVNIIDVEKSRKGTITASPADLKCSRRSSLSSSNNSSPSPTGIGNSDGLVGLRNLGNTCFMNSILQCLSHTRLLTDQLLRGSHTKKINSSSGMKGKLIHAFADLLKSMWKPGNSDAVSPHTFKTQIQRFAPRFVGYNQQDAQEFLRFLLEGLHDDLNQVKSKPKYTPCEFDYKLSHKENAEKSWKSYISRDNSLMTDLFVGQLKSMLTCCTCNYTSVTFDPFWDLSLPIPRKSGSSSYCGRRSIASDDGDSDIRDCMLSFTKEEVLDGDERPTCDKCKAKRKSTKKFYIQRFPPILVLHLKRFSGFSFRSKLQSNVDFPMKLNLAEFSADQERRSAVYSLYAVSNHSGGTYGGHYTAYCKHPISNNWHCFNDSRVDSLSSSRVRGYQAYILFYERLETSPRESRNKSSL